MHTLVHTLSRLDVSDFRLTMRDTSTIFHRITRSFKRDPLGKITQTAFWSAYRFAFTDRAAQLGGPQLMNASEVIKIVSEIVPGASASVEANPENPSAKVFLIKGIRERKRACRSSRHRAPSTRSLR